MKNVTMKGTGVYIPPNKVYNEQLDEHFEKRGLNAHNLMEHLGRRKRYFISEGENAITMCQNAIEDCIQKHQVALESIEMLIVTTDTPEYLFPSNSMTLTGIYGDKLKNVKLAFDLNSNCTGMVQGLDVAYKYMKESDIKRAMIVGCFCISPIALWDDTVVYGTFADAAACIVLETEHGEEQKGFLDTEVNVDARFYKQVVYPGCGMSSVPLKTVQPNEKRLIWNPFNMDFLPEVWCEMIHKVLERNQLQTENIDYFIFSQLSDSFNMKTLELLNVPEEKYYFVGKEYGYTGNTCPILCLNRMWDTFSIQGKKIVICTVGAGLSYIVQLYAF
ncbi:MAG: hypothetical protein NC307_06735 [Roseburia sp.]|nr:hypothetical protein [Roseburia sp.]